MLYGSLAEALENGVSADNPRRSIPPRKYTDEGDKPLIIVDDPYVFVERTGELTTISKLPELVANEPSSYLVCQNSATIVNWLHKFFHKNRALWQFKATPIERTVDHVKGRQVVISESVVSFFGFKRENGHSKSRYHYPLDPNVFCRCSAMQLYPEAKSRMDALQKFGNAVRGFIVKNEMKPTTTSGGIAGQLLRDPRFYPEMRRKVPRATNEKARPHLPGNHYRIFSEKRRFKSAYYLDQKAAHHTIASEIPLPDPNRLVARGYFHDDDNNNIWARRGTPRFEREISRIGLLKIWLSVPTGAESNFTPPYMEKPGRKVAYVYSNEIPLIRSLGGDIDGIIAAWTSDTRDNGIAKYASWAIETIQHLPESERKTIKPILLSAYGVLAAKPRRLQFAFAEAKGGRRTKLMMGGSQIDAEITQTSKMGSDKLANVIQRGMIEAETRSRSLTFARDLRDNHKQDIIMVYADSIICGAARLPLLPREWKVESELHNLHVINEVSFTSLELTKLPGIPFLDEREILDKMRRIRAPLRRKLDKAPAL